MHAPFDARKLGSLDSVPCEIEEYLDGPGLSVIPCFIELWLVANQCSNGIADDLYSLSPISFDLPLDSPSGRQERCAVNDLAAVSTAQYVRLRQISILCTYEVDV